MVLIFVSGGLEIWAEFSHTQMRILCIVDRYDELSIPNRDSGTDSLPWRRLLEAFPRDG